MATRCPRRDAFRYGCWVKSRAAFSRVTNATWLADPQGELLQGRRGTGTLFVPARKGRLLSDYPGMTNSGLAVVTA